MNNRLRRCAALTALLLLAAALPASGSDECVWTDVKRIVAVGDVHGDHDQFVKVLRAAKIIGEKNEWIAGKTHLVQNGDVPDRGPDTKKALDLLMSLEKQAEKAGGRVHAIIGNHEAMLMTGDLRYAHPGEIESFGGREGLIKAYSPKGKYGKWILGHNAAIKINDILFVHGGIGPRYTKVPLKKMNATVRKELAEQKDTMDAMIMNPAGPLWFRGFAFNRGENLDALVDPVLEYHKVRRIVIGHTPTKGGINVKGGGKVIMIDVGMCRHYGGPAAGLLIDKSGFFEIRPDTRRRLSVK
jgi:hypothetical protein